MFKNMCSAISQNKNILMLVSVCIYILSLYGVLNEKIVLLSFLLTLCLIFSAIKNLFPLKIIIIWALIFYFGVINTSFRIKDTDDLLDLAPANSTIYGEIISVPQTRDSGKTQFYFNVNKIEYDNLVKEFDSEKVLVSLNSDEKFNIIQNQRKTVNSVQGGKSFPV